MINNIIGYIHVCQKLNWEKSFDLLFNSIKLNGLYENTSEIRVGVVNDDGILIENYRLNDQKIKIIFIGKSDLYERPTLLHIKKYSYVDPENTLYYYLHTKGLRHFNTEKEKIVLKWINEMLFWNIKNWKNAVEKLQIYETYGIYYNNCHYSGNFWWSTSKHIQKLPDIIEKYYTAPEDWVFKEKSKYYCAYNCFPFMDYSYLLFYNDNDKWYSYLLSIIKQLIIYFYDIIKNIIVNPI